MTISGAVNFIVAPDKEDQKQAFIKEALMLKQALSLCSSMVKEHMRLEAVFFCGCPLGCVYCQNGDISKRSKNLWYFVFSFNR